MKLLTKMALVAAATALASPAAHAAFSANDLYLGFNGVYWNSTDAAFQNAANSDYIIDLGPATSGVGVGGSTVVNLSSRISSSTFNSIFTSGADGVNVGVVGGDNGAYVVYATHVRAGGAGTPAVAGSNLSGKSHSATVIGLATAPLTGNPWPTAGNSTSDGTTSYTRKVGPQQLLGNFYSASGVNPFGTMDSSAVVYLDLWKATTTSAYAYQGYFTVDLSGADARLSFTPLAAITAPPKPSISIARVGSTSSISLLTTSGVTYTLFHTDTAGLTTPVSGWPALSGTITGDGTIQTFHDTTTDAIRFYSAQAH